MIELEDFGIQIAKARASHLDVGSRTLRRLKDSGFDFEAALREFASRSEFEGLSVEVFRH